jgi:branched-chain amino acid transport system substrate-binding protein
MPWGRANRKSGPEALSPRRRRAAYESTDPTVDSQIVSLRASGADVLLTAAIPRMVAQTTRKVYEISWKLLHVVIVAAASIRVVLKPAGLQKSLGLISVG